jgi:predicted acetyltransferase
MPLTIHGSAEPGPTKDYGFMLDSERIGSGQIRTVPSKSAELPEGWGNHIWFEVATEHRGKGYSKRIFAALLAEAKALGLAEVRGTVLVENGASKRIIEAAGGVEIAEFTAPNGALLRLYRFAL